MAKIASYQQHHLARKRMATVPLHPTGFSKHICIEVEPNAQAFDRSSIGATQHHQSAGELLAGVPPHPVGASQHRQSAGEWLAAVPPHPVGAIYSAPPVSR